MNTVITPTPLQGKISAIPSKSQAHRLLICAAFAKEETKLICPDTNRDIEATVDCLNALGAKIRRVEDGYAVEPVQSLPQEATLPCCESGSTLRFMLPIAGALGVRTTFTMEGRLPERPLEPLWSEMGRMGCTLTRPTEDTILCTGKLRPGTYQIDGSVSSQFITGLLFSGALMDGPCQVQVTGKLESRPYITMTQKALGIFGVSSDDFQLGGQPLHSPGTLPVEGDWSNGAFFLAAKVLGSRLDIQNLSHDSPQGDRAAAALIPALEENITINAADIPDLVPILSVVAAAKKGAVFTNIQRLRLKESDRVQSILEMLAALGGRGTATEDTLTVFPTGFTGGTVDSKNDHRIAMAAAIAATVCKSPVTILDAQAVNKSYPGFWEDYRKLGGQYEQHLR